MLFEVVSDSEKERLRQQFIMKFINTTKEHYKTYIQTKKKYSDGLCYSGYLWDCLKENDKYQRECMMEQALSFLESKETVLVMWDIFSVERVNLYRVLTNNYPKDTVIVIDAKELCCVINAEWEAAWDSKGLYLPEDIYVFDSSMEWCAIFTHEGWDQTTKPELREDDYARICFLVK